MEKGGQFFLIAALIAAGVLFGLTNVINVAKGGASHEQFYDLSREIKFESKRVLDYGVFNEKDTDVLLKGFLNKYADYIAQEKVLFIFGDEEKLWGLYFINDTLTGSVNIGTGGQGVSIPMQALTNFAANVALDPATEEIVVVIDDVKYKFPRREGNNLFFVIIKEENEDSFASAG